MSKQDLENQSDAQEITVELQSGASNTSESNMNQPPEWSITDLLAINVNSFTEKKNGLTYMSWAWAWDQILRVDSNANYEVMQFPYSDNPNYSVPYQTLGDSAMVWVSVTVFGKTVTVQLPVLDFRNKCIAKPNAFDVNTSIMRCLTKGIAMHGLGLYIYAGEDLPISATQTTSEKEPPQTQALELGYQKIRAEISACTSEEELMKTWSRNVPFINATKAQDLLMYADIKALFSTAKANFF